MLRLFSTNIFDDFFFILSYEAIDQTLTQIQTMQTKFVHFVLGDHRTIALIDSPYENYGQYMRHNIVLFYFISHVLHSVCVNFIPDMHSVFYDGPGEMSHKVQFTEDQFGRNVSYCFGKFIGTALLSSNSKSEYFAWYTKFNINNQGFCKHDYFLNGHHTLSAQDTGFGVHCIWKIKGAPDEIQLHHVAFLGYNMLTFLTNSKKQDSFLSVYSCDYGGFYILYTTNVENYNIYEDRIVSGNTITYLSLCNTINNKPSFRLWHLLNITATCLVFTTFEKYSTGSAEISLVKSTCKGYRYESYGCNAYDKAFGENYNKPLLYYRNYKKREWWSSSDDGVPSCKAIWIMQNFGEQSHKNCRIFQSFQAITDVFMTGPQKIIINNWITPLTLYKENNSRTPHYNFHLNVTMLKDFPVDMTKKQQLIAVPRDQIVHTYVRFLMEMDMSTNNSDADLHVMTIKIQLFQNLVCINPQSSYDINVNIDYLYITAERITNRISVGTTNMDVDNTLYCAQRLIRKLCAMNDISHTVTVIDHVFLVHGYGFTRDQRYTNINITMVDEDNCAEYCTLDISIWENLKIAPQYVRSFAWTHVNHLVWRVAELNEGSGFRLRIDRICSSHCTYTCEVNVMFAYAGLQSSKGYSSNGHFYNDTREYTFVGSWNDAAAYCRDRGEELVSPNPLYEMAEHDSISVACHIPWRCNGVDLMEDAFYAALHKPTEVSGILQPSIPHIYDSCNILCTININNTLESHIGFYYLCIFRCMVVVCVLFNVLFFVIF